LDKCNELFQKLFPCFNDQNFISLVDFSFLEEFKSKTSHFLNEKQTLFFEKIILNKSLNTFYLINYTFFDTINKIFQRIKHDY